MYGKLYNWYAVNDDRGLAPKGWHIPTDTEWTILVNPLGGFKKAGYKMKRKLEWLGDGDNSSGFSVLPTGIRDGFAGEYAYLRETATPLSWQNWT